MKKIFVLSAVIGFSAFSFANEKNTQEITKDLQVQTLKFDDVDMTALGGCYSVSFDLPCNGQSHTEVYCTNYNEEDAGFIDDLAYIVNIAVSEGC